jgi:hypothetical protein
VWPQVEPALRIDNFGDVDYQSAAIASHREQERNI